MNHQAREQGFALVAAIFLMVILTALGAFMLNVSTVQQLTSAQDVTGSRTYWVAKAGIQWIAAAIAAAIGRPEFAGACTSIYSYSFSLDGFTVTVTCIVYTYTEGTNNTNIYWVTSTATSGGNVGSIGYTERVLNSFIEF